MTLTIRDATAADHAAWLRLWNDYLTFYEEDHSAALKAHTWARLMDPASPLKARLAVVDGQVMGFAIHQPHPSTWVMGDDIYLEDLFVDASARGQGLGRALIDDLMAMGRARGWQRIYWHTDHDNATARRLYDSYAPTDGAIRYRVKL